MRLWLRLIFSAAAAVLPQVPMCQSQTPTIHDSCCSVKENVMVRHHVMVLTNVLWCYVVNQCQPCKICVGHEGLSQAIAVTAVINLPASGGRKEFVYQINPPSTHIWYSSNWIESSRSEVPKAISWCPDSPTTPWNVIDTSLRMMWPRGWRGEIL